MSTVTAADPIGDVPSTPAWLTANVRPAGSFGRADVGRLRDFLEFLEMPQKFGEES